MFNEQVVAAHAVKVAVTENLSSNVQGFLPVHCVHQLLKSRAFSKHKVNQVRDWIYRQICASGTPLHPVLPSLIEVFVNSILIPASNRGNMADQTNDPIPEEDIRAVFASMSKPRRGGGFGSNVSSRAASPASRVIFFIAASSKLFG